VCLVILLLLEIHDIGIKVVFELFIYDVHTILSSVFVCRRL